MDSSLNQINVQEVPQPAMQKPVQAFAPVSQPPSGSKPGIPVVWMIVLIILFAAAFSAGLFLRTKKEEITNPAGPTPTLMPTETPVYRQVNPIATSGAFLKLDGYISSLTASLSAYQVENQSVSPPVLILPLGFTAE